MIVYKFGGATTRTARGLATLVSLVGATHKIEAAKARRAKDDSAAQYGLVLVVSAIGHTTRHLHHAAEYSSHGDTLLAEESLETVMRQHEDLLRSLKLSSEAIAKLAAGFEAIHQKIRLLLEGIAITRELSLRTRDLVISAGERFASLLIGSLLVESGILVHRIDSRELIVTNQEFGNAKPLKEEIVDRCAKLVLPALQSSEVVLVEGFVGATLDGVTTTMGSESSDLTATLIGASLHAKEIVIWKSVAGIFNADPELVPEARLLPKLSFAESAEIGRRGARILFETAVEPLISLGDGALLRIASPTAAARSGVIGRRSTTVAPTNGAKLRVSKPLALVLDGRLVAVRIKPKASDKVQQALADTPLKKKLRQEKYDLVRQSTIYSVTNELDTYLVLHRDAKETLLAELQGYFEIIEEPSVAALSLVIRNPLAPKASNPDQLRSEFLRSLKGIPVIAIFNAGESIVALIEEGSAVASLRKVFRTIF